MTSLEDDLLALVDVALAGVEPGSLVERALTERLLPATLTSVQVIAAGKASAAMLRGACRALSSRISRALVIAPVDPVDAANPLALASPVLSQGAPCPITWIRGDHPMPSIRSERAGRAALAAAADPGEAQALLVLLSGGASALMAAPADGLSLDDKQRTTGRLLRAGVTIHELNTVRKHLSAIKGGRLAAASPVPVVTLAISDVVGDDPGVIGSGPTVADASTFTEALAILARTGRSEYPAHVLDYLERGAAGHAGAPESPKPGDRRLAHARWHLVGGRNQAMQPVVDAARARGYEVQVREAAVVGEAREAATAWARWLAEAARRPGPVCLVSSGETTVRVTGSGLGGRNQEFALAMVEPLARLGRPAALASFGTDGVDGPTDAAGATARTDTLTRAAAAGLAPPAAFLADNDAWHFFDALSDLIRTGPTGTNVGDVQICLIG